MSRAPEGRGEAERARERILERAFELACLGAALLPLLVLVLLLGDVAMDGFARIDWDFMTGYPSRRAASAGILPALAGSAALVVVCAAFALPVGVAAAVFLEEYGSRSRFAAIVELNIANLAGVPSIIYGLLGLAVFVRFFALERSVLAGGLTLAILVLPIIITASREAIRTVPLAIREGGAALGATRWQVIRQLVLPQAIPGILTGAILAISRAIGETAPLIVVGALAYVDFLPDGLSSPFTALPIQIFNWVSRPQAAFAENAAAGIVVLMVTLLSMNAVAVVLRDRAQKRVG